MKDSSFPYAAGDGVQCSVIHESGPRPHLVHPTATVIVPLLWCLVYFLQVQDLLPQVAAAVQGTPSTGQASAQGWLAAATHTDLSWLGFGLYKVGLMKDSNSF
jgi:hypothetical protein